MSPMTQLLYTTVLNSVVLYLITAVAAVAFLLGYLVGRYILKVRGPA